MKTYGSINVKQEDENEPLLDDDNTNNDTPPTSQEQFILGQTKTSWFNILTFGWFSPILTQGNMKDQLDLEDLERIPLPSNCQTKNVTKEFEKVWEEEMQQWERQKENASTTNAVRKPPSLIKNLIWAFGLDYLKAGGLKLIHDILVFVGPIVLHGLIQFLRNPNSQMREGLLLTAAVTVSQLIMSFCLRHYFFRCYLTGLRMRSAIVMAVYKKALVLSSAERQSRTAGEIVNLMTVDAQRIQDLTTYGHALWYSFLQISVAIYFLWQQLGPSCLGGVAVIVIMVPLNKFVAGWMAKLQGKLMAARDRRVEANTEVLGSMKVIKFQAWEESFQKRIIALREAELSQLLTYSFGSGFTIMLWSAVPLFVALGTFATYTLTGNTLDVASALTALALFDILRFPLFMLPQVINNCVEAGVSFDRVRKFLLCDKYSPLGHGNIVNDAGIEIDNATFVYDGKKPKFSPSSNKKNAGEDKLQKQIHDQKWEILLLKSQLADAERKLNEVLQKDEVELNEGLQTDVLELNEVLQEDEVENTRIAMSPHAQSIVSIPYDERLAAATEDDEATEVKVKEVEVDTLANEDEDEEDFVDNLLALRRINFECQRGELIAVVGAVGSGKSTFINSILGEVRALSGTVAVKGRLSYFPQTHFIMNDTLKNNVIFGHQGEPFDEERYQKALSVCALEHDLTLLSDGDMTEIGERGITLSGGQKARVALARAVYHDADIYLLDDPIAAVDAHVGKHIFQKCIVDEIILQKNTSASKTTKTPKKSSVILVTNAIQYLSNPNVDKIMVLENGSIAEVGTYAELSNQSDSLFSQYLSVMADTGMHQSESDSVQLEQTEDEDSGLDQTEPLSPKRATRKDSVSSVKTEKSAENTTKPLMTDEMKEREKGHVGFDVYLSWIKAAGGTGFGMVLLFGYALDQALVIASKWWLTYWSRNGGGGSELRFLNIYALINLAALVTIFIRVIVVLLAGLKASRFLYAEVLDNVLKAPMEFFDTTPLGRIVNRFSKDMYTIDEGLVSALRSYLATLASVIGVIITISTVTPYFTLCLIPIIIFYIRQQVYFTKSYRELKRLDSVTRSPLYALLSETLDGVTSIRAYDASNALANRMVSMLDQQQNAYFLTITGQCWLAVRLEVAGTVIILCACLCAVFEQPQQRGNEAFAGLAGLSISFALSVTQALNWSVRMSSDLEAAMVSVERIRQYAKLKTEAPHHKPSDIALHNWPSIGIIEFKSTKLRYRDGLPLVLKGLNITIPASAKVGVVGRTGAGKSTLMVSLLRIVELDSGSISIDGIDISQLGLHLLRSKISVIPQDPCLFSGSIRSNLDPFDEFKDERLYEVLERVGLRKKSMERNLSSNSLLSLGGGNTSQFVKSLNDEVTEGGSNFSVGQRQLLVIARALLCGSKIVIMDEATASVDADTDARIQKVMRTDFKDSTCITVAHRINTIMDSDHILVMDDGRAAEFDTPKELLSRQGLFKDLVDAWEEEHHGG